MKKQSRLKLLLWERGIKQKELADNAGVPLSYLSHFLNGRVNLKPDEKERVALAVGSTVADLFEVDNEKQTT